MFEIAIALIALGMIISYFISNEEDILDNKDKIEGFFKKFK